MFKETIPLLADSHPESLGGDCVVFEAERRGFL